MSHMLYYIFTPRKRKYLVQNNLASYNYSACTLPRKATIFFTVWPWGREKREVDFYALLAKRAQINQMKLTACTVGIDREKLHLHVQLVRVQGSCG